MILFLLLSVLIVISHNAQSQIENKFTKGIQLFKLKKYNEAQKIFEDFINVDSKDHGSMYYLGRIFYEVKKFNAAVECFEKALALNENSSAYHLWYGCALSEKARRGSKFKMIFRAKKAKNEFLKAVELDSSNIEAKYYLMMYYLYVPGMFGGDKNKAQEMAAGIKQQNLERGYEAYIEIYYKEKKYTMVEELLLAGIEDFPDNTDFKIKLGVFYRRMENYHKAIEVFKTLLTVKNPEAVLNAYFEIGRTIAESGTDFDYGIECLHKVVQSENNGGQDFLINGHFFLGEIYRQKGEKDAAEKEYCTVLKMSPDFKQAQKALRKLQ